MTSVLRWREFAAGKPFHAALVPLSDARSEAAVHSHADFHELVWVAAGSGIQHLSGAHGSGEQHLDEGDLVLVRPNDTHDFTPDDRGCRLVNIAFASERWLAFLDYAEVTAVGTWESSALPIVVSDPDGAAGEAMTRCLSDYQGAPRWVDLVRLWTAVVPALESAAAAPDTRPAWLAAACAAMYREENLAAGLPRLRELAAVSDGHLVRTIGTWFGTTPVEFVNRLRLDHAATLLATTTLPVGSVAERCGFGSHAYFCARFHQRFGLTPGAYRTGTRRAVLP